MSERDLDAPDASPVLMVLDAPTVGGRPHGTAYHRADPFAPQVRVDDLGVTRGDGVFETVNAVDGHLQALEAHLARFCRSAAMLELPEPAVDRWAAAARAAAAAHPPVRELLVKLVLTRGPELEDRGATGWALAYPAPDFTADRLEGIRLLTLDRGYPGDVATLAPWLLQGAKTLSYALNMAALRHVRRTGADDAVFVSSDGLVLEGPNSTVVVQLGGRLLTPPDSLGILHGTAQRRLFAFAERRGLRTAYEPLRVEDLHTADTVWNCSSGRLAAPVRAVDGVQRGWDRDLHAALLGDLLEDRG